MRTDLMAILAGAALLVAGCGHPGSQPVGTRANAARLATASQPAERPEIAPKADLGLVKLDANLLELTPEQVEAKARERARAWRPDAELRFVGWGVAKWELLSTCSHVFYSPGTKEVCVVYTFLREKWQKAHVYDHAAVARPAETLQPLATYKVDASRSLKLARKYFSFWNKRPVSLVALTHPPKLPFAFWGIVADSTVVLVHADTGQSLSPRGFDPFPKEWTK